MKSLLLTVALLGLVDALPAQDPLTFPSEEQNITGTWYPKAVLLQDYRPVGNASRAVFPVRIGALQRGTLELIFIILKDGQCYEKKHVIWKTEEPGEYSTAGGKSFVDIVQLPVKDHVILYIENQILGLTLRDGYLLGRNREENLEALKAFKKFIKKKRLPQEDIFMPKHERCVPKPDKAAPQVCTS